MRAEQLDRLACQIDDITTDDNGHLMASVTLALSGGQKTIRADYQKAKGPIPKVGERWLIDKSLGYWTFACTLEHYHEIEKLTFTSPISPAAWSVVHGLGTKDVSVTLRETASGILTTAGGITVTDENTLTIALVATHPVGYYTAVVIG